MKAFPLIFVTLLYLTYSVPNSSASDRDDRVTRNAFEPYAAAALSKGKEDYYNGYQEGHNCQENINGWKIFNIAGIGIHAICLVIHIVVFFTFQEARNLPGFCLFSLCMSQLVGYACSHSETKTEDVNIVFIKLYAFLASYFWMNVMSYDCWWSLKLATRQLRLPETSTVKNSLIKYSMYAWGVPFGIIMMSLLLYLYNSNLLRIIYLILDVRPILVLSGINIFFFVSAYPTIRSISKISSTTVSTTEYKAVLLRRYLATLLLALVIGFIGIFKVLALILQNWVSYLITSFIVLQGIIIILGFIFTAEIRKICRSAIQEKVDSRFTTQVSTSHPNPSTYSLTEV